jgi:heptosyltransferase-3
MPSSGGRILVIRGGAIGDFVLTLPAIAALRSRFPDAHLEVLGYPHIVQLALAGGLANRVQSIEARALAGFFARDGMLEPDLSQYFAEFNLIVSYLYDPDNIFRSNVGRCSRAQFIAGPHRPNERESIPAAKVYLKPLERLAIFDADPVPRLSLNSNPDQGRADPAMAGPGRAVHPESSGSRRFSESRAERVPTLALHPGSGSESKNWPEANWAALLQHLVRETSVNLLLIGGEAEGERLQRLSAGLPRARTEVAQNIALAELARKLQRECLGFIGHDSGISHLAAALGLPGLVLWGDAAEGIWRPPHEKVAVVKGRSGPKTITVEQVLAGLTPLLIGSAKGCLGG